MKPRAQPRAQHRIQHDKFERLGRVLLRRLGYPASVLQPADTAYRPALLTRDIEHDETLAMLLVRSGAATTYSGQDAYPVWCLCIQPSAYPGEPWVLLRATNNCWQRCDESALTPYHLLRSAHRQEMIADRDVISERPGVPHRWWLGAGAALLGATAWLLSEI